MSTDPARSVRLARVAEALAAVAGSRARSVKTRELAALLGECPAEDAEALVGLLLGRPRQGRIGIGWRTLLAARDSNPPARSPSLSVVDIDRTLDEYAALVGSGSAARRRELLSALFAGATEPEQDLLLRSLGGEVRSGALEGVLTDAAAAAAGLQGADLRRAVMLGGSLGETIALALSDPERIATIGLQVGTPVQPMLASPALDVDQAIAAIGMASVEHKLDGARIQVHRDGADVRVYTRSLADVTGRVPEIVEAVPRSTAAP